MSMNDYIIEFEDLNHEMSMQIKGALKRILEKNPT